MVTLAGYQILCQIYESPQTLVYRGIRKQDNQPVILKVLKQDYPTPAELTNYQQEYEITRSLNLEGVITVYSLEKYQNTRVIILEDFGGESLTQLMKTRKLTLSEFLTIAIKITESLGQIHSVNIIHKNINPSNIIFNPTTGQLKLIDFGIATVLSPQNTPLKPPVTLEGTLTHISPEQIGRMNHPLDYRTDFYSLGITFYELLTHQLPFDTSDTLELLYYHIAKQPVPLDQINPDIPKILAKIVMKLLAKNADKRYQKAWGIQSDLEYCLIQLETTGTIQTFPLGRQDFSGQFKFPQKLYGRQEHLKTLIKALSGVAGLENQPIAVGEDGKALSPSPIEMILISGYSGIGKSALVQELYQPIIRYNGYFICGKFDQYQPHSPYVAIIQAFQHLVKQLLSESEAQLESWRKKLVAALGLNGQVIIEMIPEIELLVGKQPDIPELPPKADHNRFNWVFKNFLKVFAQPEHPLVIFLDDLQWADAASLKLIQQLIMGPDIRPKNILSFTERMLENTGGELAETRASGLLLIGAYRDNEVSENHPLKLTLAKIQNSGARINYVSLDPLNLFSVNQLILDTLKGADVKETLLLAELVLTKTQGNPFFVKEFLRAIHLDNLLYFDLHQLSWQWDLELIQERDFTANVVDVMTHKIQKLSANTQQVLKLAACIGNRFDFDTLSRIYEKSKPETAAWLREAVVEGLILPLGDADKLIDLDFLIHIHHPKQLLFEYKFFHNRIQQILYSLIPEAQKPALHWQLGQLLLVNTPLDKREEKIFDIVNHLNLGIPLITHQSEKDELASLNLIAGKKATASAAYELALNYLTLGIELLGETSWERQYELTVELYIIATQAAYANNDFEQMDHWVEVVQQRGKTLLDKVKVYAIKIEAYTMHNKMLEAVQTALPVLKLLGVRFPTQSKDLFNWLGLLKTKIALAGKSIEDLTLLPPMSDPYKLATIRILSSISAAAYLATPELLPLIIFEEVNLSIKYGNASESAPAYAYYGLILCEIGGDIKGGFEFGQFALNLLSKFKSQHLKPLTFIVFNIFVRPWQEPLKETLNPLLEAYSSALETGNLVMAAYSLFYHRVHSYFSGQDLGVLEQEMAIASDRIFHLQQETVFNYNEIYRQVVFNLLSSTPNPCRLLGKSEEEEKRLLRHWGGDNRLLIFTFAFHKLMLCYLFQEFKDAVDNADRAEHHLDAVTGLILVPLFYFYDSLARLAVFPQASSTEQKGILIKVAANQKKMKMRADHAPKNYLYKFYLVEAERHRILGQGMKAMDYYDLAIKFAKDHDAIHEEALAHELASRFYLANDKVTVAQAYILNARYCYLRWGANRKVMDLDERYSQWLNSRSNSTHRTEQIDPQKPTPVSCIGSTQGLDFATVMKASQAISSEIVLDKLLAKLMKIIIQNAGAQFGFLILEDQGKLLIKVAGLGDDDNVKVLRPISLDSLETYNHTPLPLSIINYVAHTQESVILNDATQQGKFSRDSYILEHQPKSILCAPLMNQGQLISIIYLENNLITGAFNPDSLEVVKLLSSQAAISIENAILYAQVRESERRLMQFLEAVPVGVFVVDASGKPYYINQKAQQLLGKGVIPSTPVEKIPEVYQVYLADTGQNYPVDQLPLVRALKGESSTVNDTEIHQGNRIIPTETWGTPIFDEQGDIAYAITAFQDITDRKKAEAERLRFTHQLYQLNQAYSRFVPREFLQLLDKETIVDVQLGDQVQKEMSVLFADIRSFTTLSESMTPTENFKFINAYLSRMGPAISTHHGFIDKYVGDGIMALFNRCADDAVKAGIAMLNQLTAYNQDRQRSGYVPIQIGIGINTGLLMLGTVGEQNRMDSTVISDAVNLASRIEELTKNYGASLLISHKTYWCLQNPTEYAIRIVERVKVKGKSEMVSVFEVFDADPPDIFKGKSVTRTTFEEALLLYNQHRFQEAADKFTEVLTIIPTDTVAQIYLERCQQHVSNLT